MENEIWSFFLKPPMLYVVIGLATVLSLVVLTILFRCLLRTFELCSLTKKTKKFKKYPLPNVGHTFSSSSDGYSERLI